MSRCRTLQCATHCAATHAAAATPAAAPGSRQACACAQSQYLMSPSQPQVATLLLSSGCQATPMHTPSCALMVRATLKGCAHSQKKARPSLSPVLDSHTHTQQQREHTHATQSGMTLFASIHQSHTQWHLPCTGHSLSAIQGQHVCLANSSSSPPCPCPCPRPCSCLCPC